MSEELNSATFDLVGVLSGRDYPTTTKEVYFNEALGFSINELRGLRDRAVLLQEEEKAKELQESLDSLIEETKSQKFTIHFQSIPEGTRRDISRRVEEEYPTKKDLIGREEKNPEADDAFTIAAWDAYITKVEDPEGAIAVGSREVAESIYNDAPETVHLLINEAISELRSGARDGFEFAAKELDFLSFASPEG